MLKQTANVIVIIVIYGTYTLARTTSRPERHQWLSVIYNYNHRDINK